MEGGNGMEMGNGMEVRMEPKKVKRVVAEVRWADAATCVTLIENPSIQYCTKCFSIIFGFEPYTRCPNCGNQEVRMEPKKIKRVVAEVRWADSCTAMTIIENPSVQYCVECEALIFGFSKYERCPNCGNQLF